MEGLAQGGLEQRELGQKGLGQDLDLVVDYRPRDQFASFHDRSERFACIVTHRRAGKTVACIHELQQEAMRCPLVRPRFAYLSPFLRQSKAVAWDYLRAAVAPLRPHGATAHESELRVDYPEGGQVRLYGADNPDAMRGIYLDGIVLDEYADMDPRMWSEIIRPALADRQGWAVFIGTPKGRNAFFELWRRSQREEGWFSMMLKASHTGLIPDSELALARRDLTEEQYAQEFECSFDAAVVGAYYGKLMARAEAERRVAGVPYDPSALVWTSWDLGIRDATAIWFAQVIGREIRIIDYYEASGVDLGHYVREINARPMSMPGTSCRTTRRPRSSAPARAGSRSWKAWGSGASRSRRCTGSRTASTRYACSCRAAGSTRRNARAASTRSSSTAPTTTPRCRRSARSPCTTGPRTPRTRFAISP
jgi:hypothetical protein